MENAQVEYKYNSCAVMDTLAIRYQHSVHKQCMQVLPRFQCYLVQTNKNKNSVSNVIREYLYKVIQDIQLTKTFFNKKYGKSSTPDLNSFILFCIH